MSGEFQKSPYILIGEYSGNARKHLVNVFMCVSNPLEEHSFILVKTRKMSDKF